jgi:hypothetical protein
VGLVIGAGAAAALWKTGHGMLRPLGAAAGVLGAAAGFASARRRRWDDTDVALYLDAKLDAEEAIATAVELDGKRDDELVHDAHVVVISQATRALAQATRAQVRAPLFRPWHAALPVAGAAIAYMSVIPLPKALPGAAPPPGVDRVQLADVAGLEKIIKLSEIDARDEAQKERFRKLADEARRMQDKIRAGTARREAQADIAKLRDAITAERLSLGDGEQRAGMESALGKLGENPDLKNAEKALGDRDMVGLDEEMERLANKLEKSARQRAQKTLEEAADAAKKAGAKDVAKELEQQKRRMMERGKKADKLRELAQELGSALRPEGKEALEDWNRSGSGEDAQKLADALEKGLEKLTPEQRRRLTESLKKQIEKTPEEGIGKGPSKQQLKDLAEQLGTPEGQKQLEEELKHMAEAPEPGSDEAERQKALDNAEEGAGEAEGQLGGGAPMPIPVAGSSGKDGKSSPSKSAKDGMNGTDAQPGHSDGGGPGSHKGQTGVVEGGEMKARASAMLNKGKPMPGIVMGRGAARAGETANIVGTGALGAAAPGEVGGMDRSEVPEEYREQVGRYFQPK